MELSAEKPETFPVNNYNAVQPYVDSLRVYNYHRAQTDSTHAVRYCLRRQHGERMAHRTDEEHIAKGMSVGNHYPVSMRITLKLAEPEEQMMNEAQARE